MGRTVPSIPPEFRAFVTVHEDGRVRSEVTWAHASDLPHDDVTIRVRWSSVNYKDGLATLPESKVARISPLIPGTDLAGTVIASDDHAIAVGSEVIAHGHELGTSHHGGYAEFARVPAGWTLPVPVGLSAREAMVLGTAGFTAARSVDALERRGLSPTSGPVLVTGATGGVGGLAIGILVERGYEVWALTSKAEAQSQLRDQGVRGFVTRSDLDPSPRKLDPERWAGAIDPVGAATLPYILRTLKYGAAVAASGNVSGSDLSTSVFPFILRDCSLIGIDSAHVAPDERSAIWNRLADDLRPRGFAERVTEIGLDGLAVALETVLAGKARGRYVVRVADDVTS
jgi:acrylyl-CoA reductase (NADPH)